jgi:hypothetical protein
MEIWLLQTEADHICKSTQASLKRKDGATGVVTLIQRFGSALNLEKQT